MFNGAEAFNGHLTHWDVSKVTAMVSTFAMAFAFNQQLLDWDVSKVTTINNIFESATSFNQPYLAGTYLASRR